jgi:RNA polymerase sigma factor (sigma-70 family)
VTKERATREGGASRGPQPRERSERRQLSERRELSAQRAARHAGLLTQARAGDRDALGTMVAELTPLLWHVARDQGLSAAAAEDVVQTTWLSLLRELDSIRAPESLVAWLVTVARREAGRVRERGRRERSVSEFADDHPASGERPDQAVIDDERKRLLWDAIGHLPQRCRALLRLIAFVDRPDYDAVSTALGMPRGSIGPTRGRCLAKLRTALTATPYWS